MIVEEVEKVPESIGKEDVKNGWVVIC